MKLRPISRYGLLACSAVFLGWLAWQTLAGGFRQARRARTVGQKVETLAQIECGALSVLVILTTFRWRRWAGPVRLTWGLSLATAAGLSALVWGPPMPLVGAVFITAALLIAHAVTRALRTYADDLFQPTPQGKENRSHTQETAWQSHTE